MQWNGDNKECRHWMTTIDKSLRLTLEWDRRYSLRIHRNNGDVIFEFTFSRSTNINWIHNPPTRWDWLSTCSSRRFEVNLKHKKKHKYGTPNSNCFDKALYLEITRCSIAQESIWTVLLKWTYLNLTRLVTKAMSCCQDLVPSNDWASARSTTPSFLWTCQDWNKERKLPFYFMLANPLTVMDSACTLGNCYWSKTEKEKRDLHCWEVSREVVSWEGRANI